MTTVKMTLGRLRAGSKTIENWCGAPIKVRLHPGLWDTVYDLPGFLTVENYRMGKPVDNEIGCTEFFHFILDPGLQPDSWTMDGALLPEVDAAE